MLHRKERKVVSAEPSRSCWRPKSCRQSTQRERGGVGGERLRTINKTVFGLQLSHSESREVTQALLPGRTHLISRETNKLQQLQRPCGQHGDHLQEEDAGFTWSFPSLHHSNINTTAAGSSVWGLVGCDHLKIKQMELEWNTESASECLVNTWVNGSRLRQLLRPGFRSGSTFLYSQRFSAVARMS